MAKKQIKKSNTVKLYEQELKRIKSFIKRVEKRGYIVSENIIPQRPKKVTKSSVKRLKKITPQEIYKKSEFLVEETGEIISGLEGQKLERKLKAQKAVATRKAKQKAEREFFSEPQTPIYYASKTGKKADHKPIKKSQLESGGETMTDNFIDEFIMKISSPVPTVTPWGTHRSPEVIDIAERERLTLYSLTMIKIRDEGKNQLGFRLDTSDVHDWLATILYEPSDGEKVMMASRGIADSLNGKPLTMSDYADIAYEQEMNEWHEEPK